MPVSERRPLSPVAIALIIIALALAAMALWLLAHRTTAPPPPPAPGTWPDRRLTPGAADTAVSNRDICAHDWAPGSPPHHGGDLTYSRAARHTAPALKAAVFAAYHLTNPHDGGRSYEVDHLIPLALGGRDVLANLWPESRLSQGPNAWSKDRLEYRLYRLVCDPEPGTPALPLQQAQAAFTTDWVAAYHHYCPTDADCPAFRED